MPFAVADSLSQRGIAPVLFALRGACDPARVERFRHHWISVGQLGRATKLFRSEGCRDLIFIGTLLARRCRNQARLGNDPRARPRLAAFRAVTIICCRASAASSNRTAFGWSASGMSPPTF